MSSGGGRYRLDAIPPPTPNKAVVIESLSGADAIDCPSMALCKTALWERLASRFIATCCVADAPGECLPMPPVEEHLRPVTLAVEVAFLVQALTRDGRIPRAVRLCNGVPDGEDEDVAPGSSSVPSSSSLASRATVPRRAEEWTAIVEKEWLDAAVDAEQFRDRLEAEADAAHASFLSGLGLRCACAGSGARQFWHCEGTPLSADDADASSSSSVTISADRQLALSHDECQGVDDDLRDRYSKAQRRVERYQGLLRWSANAKQLLTDPEATCGVCLEGLFHVEVACWPCLHLVCAKCEHEWRKKARRDVDSGGVPCPHCKMPARRGEITIFGARDAPMEVEVGQQGGPATATSTAIATGIALSDSEEPPPSPPLAKPERAKLAALTALVASLLAEGDDERVVIFGQWQGVLGAVEAALGWAGITMLTLVGVSLEQRIDALRRFGQPEEVCRVLLLSSGHHASGVNLQCARHCILVHPYCPDVGRESALRERSLADARAYETQAIGRVRRYPQQRQVSVHRLFVRGTIEEELLASQGVGGV